MAYNVGLDFGTTNSIISYLNESAIPVAFDLGGAAGRQEYIPSFIAYEDDDIEIGAAARNMAIRKKSSIQSFGNFKMFLPFAEEVYPEQFRNNGHTPVSVTQHYLQKLSSRFASEKGSIENLVVTVPELWQRNIKNLGRVKLQNLIKEDLKLPLMQLVSEPVAAAAYYAWRTQRIAEETGSVPFHGNLLVCDMGGGTFDVCLCSIASQSKVEVLQFEGQGDKGLASAGVAFDRRITQIAYTKKEGRSIDENSSEFEKLCEAFEKSKILADSEKIAKKLTNYFNAPEDLGKKELYYFEDYPVTCGDVIEAFAPIKDGVYRVMGKIKEHLDQEKLSFDRLLMVGGFSQFILVQRAIREALGIEETDPRIDRNIKLTEGAFAISYGACLIANKLIDPVERYTHTIGMKTPKGDIPLLKGGKSLDELADVQFYPDVFSAFYEKFDLKVWIKLNSEGSPIDGVIPISLPNYSTSSKYKVGLSVNRSYISYLTVKEVNSQEMIEYEMGHLFQGFYLPDENNHS
jgi:molecular chaperone DnaK